ncbi:MAG: hypothetical protein V1906_00455 [Candidatus Woesearchaeota archaeon]
MARRKRINGLDLILDETPISADYMGRQLKMPQGSLINKFNSQSRILASMPNIYNEAKKNYRAIIDNLKSDIESTRIVTSTLIDYKKNALDAKITHYYNSSIVVPIQNKVLVPIYHNANISEVLSNEEGLMYIRAMFNTQDNPEDIITTLRTLSYTDSIWVMTSDRQFEDEDTKMAAALGHMYGRLVIYANLNTKTEEGRSRGIRIMP